MLMERSSSADDGSHSRGGGDLKRGLMVAMMVALLALAGCKQHEPTLAQLRAQVKRNPDSIEHLVALGDGYLDQEMYHNAYVAFKRAYDLSDRSYEAAYGLAQTYRQLHDAESAMVSVKRALHLRPEEADAYALQGHLYLMMAEPGKAVAKLERALELKSDHEVALEHLSMAYLAEGEDQNAEAAGHRAVRQFPDNMEFRVKFALVLANRKKYDEAEVQLRKAVELAPEEPMPYLRLADLLIMNKRKLPEARELAQKAMAIDPGDGAAAAIAALALHKMGRTEEAATELRQAARAHPENHRIWLHLVQVFKALGEDEAARRAAEMAVRVGPRPRRVSESSQR